MGHTSLSVIAVNACHNSLPWFIERVELLTPDPIQTQQYFLIHLEQSLYVPAQGLSFHLDQKYLAPIWKGKGKGKLYIQVVSINASIDDFEGGIAARGAVPFHFGGKGDRPEGMKIWRDRGKHDLCDLWLPLSLSRSFTLLQSYRIIFFLLFFFFADAGVFWFTVVWMSLCCGVCTVAQAEQDSGVSRSTSLRFYPQIKP